MLKDEHNIFNNKTFIFLGTCLGSSLIFIFLNCYYYLNNNMRIVTNDNNATKIIKNKKEIINKIVELKQRKRTINNNAKKILQKPQLPITTNLQNYKKTDKSLFIDQQRARMMKYLQKYMDVSLQEKNE